MKKKATTKAVYFAPIDLDPSKSTDKGSLSWTDDMCMSLAKNIKTARLQGHGRDVGTFNSNGHQKIAALLDKEYEFRKAKNWTDKHLVSKVKSKVKELVPSASIVNNIL